MVDHEEKNEDRGTLTIDDCNDAIVGIAYDIKDSVYRVVYDRVKLVSVFVGQGMSEEEADEWVSFNVEGAYMGPGTPIIVSPMQAEEVLDLLKFNG